MTRSQIASARPLSSLLLAGLILGPLALPGAATASIDDLVAFMNRTERMATPQRSVTAKVTLTEGEGTKSFILVIDPASSSQLLWVPETGFRAVIPLSWSDGKSLAKTGASTTTVGADEMLGGTSFRGIDFFPFWKSNYTQAFISDENRLEKSVSTYAGADSPYKLFVIAFDKAKMVPRSIKYFRESFNDLVRLRVDGAHIMVGARPRPTQIRFQDFAENSTSAYTLEWTVLENSPGDLMKWSGVED
jgi:hypothetical protein